MASSSKKQKSSNYMGFGANKRQRGQGVVGGGGVPTYANNAGQLLRARSGEFKFIDTWFTDPTEVPSTLTDASVTLLVNGIAVGNDGYQRIGREISMVSLKAQGYVNYVTKKNPTTGNFNENMLRIVFVYDAQPSAVMPSFDAIFGRQGASGPSAQYVDPIKPGASKRFSVLSDELIRGVPSADPGTGGTLNEYVGHVPVNVYLKLWKSQKIVPSTEYSGTGATIGSIQSGAVYMFLRALHDTNFKFVVTDKLMCRFTYLDN